MKLLRKLIREFLQSHSEEPRVGDPVLNINPGCKHYRSHGIVQKIEDLPMDKGRIVVYVTDNSGENWSHGDILRKTMDQLEVGL